MAGLVQWLSSKTSDQLPGDLGSISGWTHFHSFLCCFNFCSHHSLLYIYIYNCRQYCFGVLGLISVLLMLGWRSHMVTPNDPTLVVSSKPCQSAQTSSLVSMGNAGEGGILIAKIFKGKFDVWTGISVGVWKFKPKNLPWVRNGYFLEHHTNDNNYILLPRMHS